jgi:hypothetical protein
VKAASDAGSRKNESSNHGTDYAPAWRNLQLFFHDAMQHTPVLRATSLAKGVLRCHNSKDEHDGILTACVAHKLPRLLVFNTPKCLWT